MLFHQLQTPLNKIKVAESSTAAESSTEAVNSPTTFYWDNMRQELKMTTLESELSVSVVMKYEWDWWTYSTNDPDEWFPHYKLCTNISRADIWKQWVQGLDGFLSVEELMGCKMEEIWQLSKVHHYTSL
ncbi:hypothetical protein L218DRAFT_951221 [Marasmius fiardii PR-910]|nr:hypothetical protein L218DRAFT_951221 [Marasmius fiardii PR-910]